MPVTPDEAACQLLEVVPGIMRIIRAEMRAHRAADLSVPQFRALAYLKTNPGTSLSSLADHIGLTLPSMSKLVDGLVGRKLVTRETPEGDRRRITLTLTARGRATLQSAYSSAQAHLAKRLAALPEHDRATVVEVFQALRPLFEQDRTAQNSLTLAHNGHS